MKDDEKDGYGFGSLFKGLDKFISLMADMVENEKDEVDIKGTIGDGGRKKDIAASYGFKIKLGGEDTSRIQERMNDIRDRAGEIREKVGDTRERYRGDTEPAYDIFDEEDRVVIAMEMPGAALNDISCNLEGSTISVTASNRNVSYSRKIELKFIPEPGDISVKLNNGIYTMQIKKNIEG